LVSFVSGAPELEDRAGASIVPPLVPEDPVVPPVERDAAGFSFPDSSAAPPPL
jgi:hypothetical protein